MLDVREVTERLDEVRAQLEARGFREPGVLAHLAELSDRRRALITTVEGIRHERKVASTEMGQVKDKKSDEFAARREELKKLGDKLSVEDEVLRGVEAELEALVLQLPNLPSEDAPDGLDESQNVELRVWGTLPDFGFEPKDHIELGQSLGVLDFDRAVKIAGPRFSVLRGLGVRALGARTRRAVRVCG